MAASAIAFDHNLEERIYQLQKLSDDTGVKQILEEAAHLCDLGRHIEAAALVDKAGALHEAASTNQPAAAPAPTLQPVELHAVAPPAKEEPFAARLVGEIATGLAKVLTGAFQDLERHLTGAASRANDALGQRLDKLQSAIESLQPLHGRLEQLVEAGVAVQEKYEQVAAATLSLQESSGRHTEEIGALRQQVQKLSASANSRMEEVCRRIEGQEHDLSTAHSALSELASKMATAAERLERHAGAIRSIHQEHRERAAALDHIAEALSRLRTPPADGLEL